MFQIDSNTQLVLDYGSGCVRIMTNIFPSGFRPKFNLKAEYYSSNEWYKSSFVALVISDELLDQISWFWNDIEGQTKNSQGESL